MLGSVAEEASIASLRLTWPQHVVALVTEDRAALVTEPVGTSLLSELQRLPSAAARIELMRLLLPDMVKALVHCHARGIEHNDVRAANFIIVADEMSGRHRAVLIDFGMSSAIGAEPQHSRRTDLLAKSKLNAAEAAASLAPAHAAAGADGSAAAGAGADAGSCAVTDLTRGAGCAVGAFSDERLGSWEDSRVGPRSSAATMSAVSSGSATPAAAESATPLVGAYDIACLIEMCREVAAEDWTGLAEAFGRSLFDAAALPVAPGRHRDLVRAASSLMPNDVWDAVVAALTVTAGRDSAAEDDEDADDSEDGEDGDEAEDAEDRHDAHSEAAAGPPAFKRPRLAP